MNRIERIPLSSFLRAYIQPGVSLYLGAGFRTFAVASNSDHGLPILVHERGQVCGKSTVRRGFGKNFFKHTEVEQF